MVSSTPSGILSTSSKMNNERSHCLTVAVMSACSFTYADVCRKAVIILIVRTVLLSLFCFHNKSEEIIIKTEKMPYTVHVIIDDVLQLITRKQRHLQCSFLCLRQRQRRHLFFRSSGWPAVRCPSVLPLTPISHDAITYAVMPSSHRRHDKTRLSCRVGVGGYVN